MPGLLDLRQLGVTFDAGTTALGHHWNLVTGEEERPVGTTERRYKGKGMLGRVWTVTGLDANNDILADVLDADGSLILKLRSSYEGRTEVWNADGSPLGEVVRDKAAKAGPHFHDAHGALLARLEGRGEPTKTGYHDAYVLLDAGGEELGVLTGQRPKRTEYSLLDDLLGLDYWEHARAYEATMHHGFRNWMAYWITLADRPLQEPLRTFAVLAPVLCGYSY